MAVKPIISLSVFLLSIFISIQSLAAVITSTTSGGAWTTGSSWVGGIVPAASDTAVIASGATITVSGTVSATRVVFANDATESIALTLESGTNFTVSGQMVINAPAADDKINLFDVASGSATIGSLTLANSALNVRRVIANVGSGTLTVNGNINYSVTNNLVRRQLNVGENGTLVLNGGFSGIGEHTFHPSSIVKFNTNGNQNIMAATYGNLELLGGGVKTSTSTLTVIGTLTLNGANLAMNHNLTTRGTVSLAGVIVLNNVDFTLTPSSTISGNFGVSAHISLSQTGKIIKQGNTIEAFQATYPLGNSQGYMPITISRIQGTLAGADNSRFIELASIDSRHPLANGTGNALNTFWRIRSVNITNITRFAFTANYSDVSIPAGVNEADLNAIARLTTSNWALNPTGSSINAGNNQISFDTSNIQISGDYTIGEITAFPTAINEIFSVQNGNWNTASTWSSNAIPPASSNVIVLHRISAIELAGVNNLTIANTGILISDPSSTIVNGNLDVFGTWNDVHSGGQNVVGGRFTLHPGGNVSFTGSGGNTLYTEFRGDVIINGSFNTNGLLTFTAVNQNKIRLTNNSNITLGGPFWCNVDSLIIQGTGSISTNDTVRLGAINNPRNIVLLNNHYLDAARNMSGRPNGNFERKFVQGPNGHIRLRSSASIFNGNPGIFDATAVGNTVEYGASSSQPIFNTNYHHLVISGDRFDRFKTLGGSNDVTIGGNLTVNNNGSIFQCGNSMNGRTINVNGNMVFEGNGRIFIGNPGTKVNLIVGGKLLNNNNSILEFRQNDSTYFNTTFAGSGIIAEGTGNLFIKTLKTVANDSIRWNLRGITNIFDSISVNSPAFLASQSSFFVPASRTVYFTGSSQTNKIGRIQLTDRGDRSFRFFQQLPVEIDSSFLLSSSGANQPAFYDFAGQTLIINNNLAMSYFGQGSANSALRPDSASTLIIRGNGTVGNLSFPPGFRNIGTLEIDRPAGVTAFTNNTLLRVYNELKLTGGDLNVNGRVSMHPRSTVIRKKGKMLGNFQNTSGKYNVVYTDSVTTGNEATGLSSITSIKVAAGAGNVVAFGNSPTVDSSFIVESGQLAALQNNYLRLGTAATAQVDRVIPTTLFPVGTTTGRGFFELTVNSAPAGLLTIKPVNAPHPRRASAPSYLRKYITLGGTATTQNVDVSVLYDDADVFGVEANLATSFYNGTAWSTVNGTIDTDLNKATMTGITAFGDVTAGANMGDTTVSTASKLIQSGVEVYPNPGQGEIFIWASGEQLNGSKLFISDLTGKVLRTAQLLNNRNSISTSTLQAGVYHIKVLDPNGKVLLQAPWMKQ